MKTIEEIFDDFYNQHVKKTDKDNSIKKKIDDGNYQFVLGYALAHGIGLTKEVNDAGLYLKFKLLSSRQIGNVGQDLFREDYERVNGAGTLKKFERGSQEQLNPDFLETKKEKNIEVKTGTIYTGNKFIYEQIRLKDQRINHYVFLGITPEGRFYWVLDKRTLKPGRVVFGAKLSPQHSTSGSNATYQWHPSFEQMKESIIQPDELGSAIV